MSKPKVFIILLTYNMKTEAQRCLQSLQGLTYPNHRVVVVDNGSPDGIEAMVRSEFPQAITIQTGGNLGYTGGNNRGIAYALSAGADYVLIMNPDTVLANPGFLDEMVAYMEEQIRVGIAGPRVFLREKGKIQNTVLFAPGLWRNLRSWVHVRLEPKHFELSGDHVVDAEVLNGVCLLIRSACLREIGLFDENIFMYIEDVEMDDRARRHGWHIRYLPIDSIIHHQKLEGYNITSNVSFLIKRNSVYYLCKIGKRVDAYAYAALSLALMAARALFPVRRGSLRENVEFCRRLAAAYRTVFRETSLPSSKIFSPISSRTST